MKLYLIFGLLSALVLVTLVEGKVVNCKSDADCASSQCCVSYQSGPGFCRGKKSKGDDCDLGTNFAWCPCEKSGMKCVDAGDWPIHGVVGKCQ